MPELREVKGSSAFAFGHSNAWPLPDTCGHGDFPLLSSVTTGGFSSSRFESVSVPSLTALPSQCFSSATLTAFSSDAVLSAGQRTFLGCKELLSVSLPYLSGVQMAYTFSGCSALRRISIARMSGTMGTYTCNGCSALEVLDMSLGTELVQLTATNAFTSVPATCKIVVADNLVATYKSASNWSTYANQIIGRTDAIAQGIITGD